MAEAPGCPAGSSGAGEAARACCVQPERGGVGGGGRAGHTGLTGAGAQWVGPEAGAGADDPFRPHASSFSTLYSTECIQDEQTVWSCSFGSCILKSPVHLPLTTRSLIEPAGSGGELSEAGPALAILEADCGPQGTDRPLRCCHTTCPERSLRVIGGGWSWARTHLLLPLQRPSALCLLAGLLPAGGGAGEAMGGCVGGWRWGWGSRGRPQSKAVICPWTGGSPELPCTMFPGSVFATGLPTVRSTHDLYNC